MVVQKNDKFILVKIFKESIDEFDINNKENVINLFKEIFLKLKKKYNLSGLFDVDVFVNPEYGMILEIVPVYEYLEEIDMRIKIHLDCVFLDLIDSSEILDYEIVYYYKDKFYGVYNGKGEHNVLYHECCEIIDKGIRVY